MGWKEIFRIKSTAQKFREIEHVPIPSARELYEQQCTEIDEALERLGTALPLNTVLPSIPDWNAVITDPESGEQRLHPDPYLIKGPKDDEVEIIYCGELLRLPRSRCFIVDGRPTFTIGDILEAQRIKRVLRGSRVIQPGSAEAAQAVARLERVVKEVEDAKHKHFFKIVRSTPKTVEFQCSGCDELRRYRRTGLHRILTKRGTKMRARYRCL